LATHVDAAQLKFVRQAMLIGGLKKTGPKGPVDFQTSIDDVAADFLDLLRDPFVVFVSFVVQS
jgi:hypothetical protein